jgi:tetratricopeptide (TPR) repeat protein
MTTPRPFTRPAALLLAALLLAAAAFGIWWFGFRNRTKPDPVAAAAANARGVGHMEQFEYRKAKEAFEQAALLAPDWLPARINLGMALYNSAAAADDPVLGQAINVFEQVLREDPDNPYAHFNLGIILKYQGQYEPAAGHFRKVTEIDPTDDRAWLYLGQSDPDAGRSKGAKKHFEKALELNPYLVPARYAIANHQDTSEEEQTKLLAVMVQLQQANWEDEARDTKHSEQGRYATAIGRGPVPPPDVGPPMVFEQQSNWAVEGDVKWAFEFARKRTTPLDLLLDSIHARHGFPVARLDFNADGKPDLLLLSAVIRDGKMCDVLFRNDGGKFTDVSEAMGLGNAGSLGCAVGDYDNDGWPDLALTTPEGVRLLRNVGGKASEDVTAKAGFDKVPGVFLPACWLDLDQDGDLDLIAGKADGMTGSVVVFQNIGVAPPSRADEPPPPLSTAFKRIDVPSLTDAASQPVIGLAALDIDGDKDVDLVVLRDGLKPTVVLNDRLMRFRIGGELPTDAANLTGGLVFDSNSDDQSDLLFTATDKPAFLVSKQQLPGADFAKRFAAGATDAPPLLQAQRCDLDLDGRADVVGLSKDGRPVFLQGDGAGRLGNVPEPFGPAVEKLGPLHAVAVTDLDGDGHPDLIAVSHRDGLKVFRGLGNGNRGLKLRFTGKRDNNNAGVGQKNLRTAADAVGVKVQTITGPLISTAELTTLSAGPGQSLLPLDIGIGKATQADAVRIRWPDCVVQAELATAAGGVVTIGEINRKPTSCPVLMTWDGSRWVYVTDFLGGGALGECGPDGTCRPPRPEESVKIEPHQLGSKGGQYVLRIAEPMDEVMYLDHVRLDVIDHPAGATIFPDERFAVADPKPTQKLLLFRDRAFSANATDHTGVDRTKTVADRDGKTVDGFAHRSWLGFAEEHWLELDFADRLKRLPKDRPLFLALAGWTDYPYPESILAAGQAGVDMLPPVLERQTGDGKWEKVCDTGFPAGLPKVITVPLPDAVRAAGKLRLRTNLQIYWDQVSVGAAEEPTAVHGLTPLRADLAHPGFVQEVLTNGKPPQAYDPERFEPVAVTKWKGKLTKLGDVTELLAGVDDRLVLCGPGDEVTVRFDAAKLPPVPPGMVRSFVLRAHGYCKDTSPTTVTGGEVGPLPFRAMPNYPPPKPCPPTADETTWHTRPAGR